MVNELLRIQYNIAKANVTDRKVQNLGSYLNTVTLKALHNTMKSGKASGIDKVTFSPTCVFIFCNKRKNAIKVLRYDKNGFILATKKLLEGMKFQWPKDACNVKSISRQQVSWLLQGLEIEQKKALKELDIHARNTCF